MKIVLFLVKLKKKITQKDIDLLIHPLKNIFKFFGVIHCQTMQTAENQTKTNKKATDMCT